MRVARSRCLIGMWEDGEFVFENYLSRKRVAITPAASGLLDTIGSFEPVECIVERWRQVPGARQLIRRFLDHDLLVEKASELDARERLLDSTWQWGNDCRYFHFSTNIVDFESDPSVQREELIARAKESPLPSPYLECKGEFFSLEEPQHRRQNELWEALASRRTCRSYTGKPISSTMLAEILRWSWGQTGFSANPRTGDLITKTSPSGGARHPIEVYAVILAVD